MPASTARRGAASLDEGLPLSLAEAMVARRPIVATDSARELVEVGEPGLLVRRTDADALAGDPPACVRFWARGGAWLGGTPLRDRRLLIGAMVSAVSRQYRELLDG